MAGSERDAPIIVNNGGDGHVQENSPKNSLIEEAKGESSIDDGLIVMEAASEDNDAEDADTGQWEVLEETRVAVDYSNVHVFLKTLNSWQEKKSGDLQEEKESQGCDSLQVNFDEALCQQVFSSQAKDCSEEEELDNPRED